MYPFNTLPPKHIVNILKQTGGSFKGFLRNLWFFFQNKQEYWQFEKNRIWCRQLRNVVNFSHATQKPQRLPPLGFSCINENYDRYKKRSCREFHTASWPVRESNPGLRRERASSWPLDQQAGIEATRFELATSASRTQRSTKLSHASMSLRLCVLCCSPATRI